MFQLFSRTIQLKQNIYNRIYIYSLYKKCNFVNISISNGY